jgi:tetratricopeptide (TPR) repeat protein
VSSAIEIAERVVRLLWRVHFRIPPAVYWTVLLFGTLLAFFVSANAWPYVGLAAALGLSGVLRWRWHQRHRPMLVVPLFSTVAGNEGRARRAQELIIDTLGQLLTPAERARVHAVPTVVGPADQTFANALLVRLRALYVVYGRIDERPDGAWSIFAGVAASGAGTITHLDWHTRDRTPGEATWDLIVARLTPARGVADEPDPLLFSGELATLVRAVGGRVALILGDDERALRLLREALAVSGSSTSHVIDDVRSELAVALVRQGDRPEALRLLRERAQGENPAPELLRTLARCLGPQPGDFVIRQTDEERAEAIWALRRGANSRNDPKRAMTLYNLSVDLGVRSEDSSAESMELLEEAMEASRYYRRAWYVRRTLAAHHWHTARRFTTDGLETEARQEYKAAARWYSRAIRSRPRVRFGYWTGAGRVLLQRFPPSPLLHANAHDAHREAGHRYRTTWHGRRAGRRRSYHFRWGFKRAEKGEWERAYANFDFARVGSVD